MKWLHVSEPRRIAATAGVVLTLVVIGWAVASYKLSLVGDTRHIGHADEAAYAEMGRSLAAGRGFDVRHVSVFFIPYDRGIQRREDHWPPFMGMMIAPFIAVFGVEAWAAKLPAILVGSIGLPLATAALGIALSRRAYVGLLAGLCMLADVTVFTESLKTLSDVTLAMLVTAWLACVVGARSFRWLHVGVGALAAAAFYAKGSHIILLALWPAASLLVEGWRVFARKWIYLGGGVAVVLIGPWLIANGIDYGNPMHTTQNFAAGFIALDDWEQRFYRPHWGRDLPGVSDRWTKHPEAYQELVPKQRESFTRWGLLGPRARESQWYDMGAVGAMVHGWLAPADSRHREKASQWRPAEWPDPVATWCGILGAITVLGAGIAWGVQAAMHLIARLRHHKPNDISDTLAAPILAILIVAAAQWVFVVYLWQTMPRLALVFLPTAAVLAATGVSRLIEAPFLWRGKGLLQRWHWAVTPPLCALAIALTWWYAPALKAYHAAEANLDAYPYAEQPFYPDMGRWLGENLPTAVVMTRNPWELRFASPDTLRAVGLPYAEPGVILWIARYYHVTHYLDDQRRPGMHRYLNGRHPALERVAGAPGSLYRIHWDRLPPEELRPPHGGAVMD